MVVVLFLIGCNYCCSSISATDPLNDHRTIRPSDHPTLTILCLYLSSSEQIVAGEERENPIIIQSHRMVESDSEKGAENCE